MASELVHARINMVNTMIKIHSSTLVCLSVLDILFFYKKLRINFSESNKIIKKSINSLNIHSSLLITITAAIRMIMEAAGFWPALVIQ